MRRDRITIRFKDPKDLQTLKEMADARGIKMNRLITRLLIRAIEMEENQVDPFANYTDEIKNLIEKYET